MYETPESTPSVIPVFQEAAIPSSNADETSPFSDALDLVVRRELAIRATEEISEVLQVDVTIPQLLLLASDAADPGVQLTAGRALRAVESIARDDSEVVRTVGETNLYHYVEGVITYGASEQRYLALMREHEITAEEATGLYALRQAIAEESRGGRGPGFSTIIDALHQAGIDVQDADQDYEDALVRLDEAGFFINCAGSKIFDRPIFAPELAGKLGKLGTNIDTYRGDFAVEELQIDPIFSEEIED